MTFPPAVRRAALTLHAAASVGWIGAVLAFLALALSGVTRTDAREVRAAYLAADLLTRDVIVPLALAALLTGVLQALGTRWGLARHYWVLIKLLLTAGATLVLLLQLPTIRALARFALTHPLGPTDALDARWSLVVHGSGGLLVLQVVTALSVFKPRGTLPWPDRPTTAARHEAQR